MIKRNFQWFKFIYFFTLLTIIFSTPTIKADIILPPTDIFWTPFTIVVFLANLFLNFIVFTLGYIIFIERNIHKINKKSFFITILLITLLGFIADSITLQFYDQHNLWSILFVLIFATFLIFFFNFLIYKIYLKLSTKKSIILSIWISLLTNPFLYIVLTGFISLFITPSYHPVYPY